MNDYDDDQTPQDSEDRKQWLNDAIRRVQTPGLLLQIFGGISLFITVAYVTLLFAAPEVLLRGQYDFMADLQKGQPNAKQQPPFEEFVKEQQIQSGAMQILAIAGSIVIFLAGGKMRQLKSYGLAMTGSIMAILPICTNNCCCLSIPFGIWALVVLLNSDVKLAFAKIAERSANRGVVDDSASG